MLGSKKERNSADTGLAAGEELELALDCSDEEDSLLGREVSPVCKEDSLEEELDIEDDSAEDADELDALLDAALVEEEEKPMLQEDKTRVANTNNAFLFTVTIVTSQ